MADNENPAVGAEEREKEAEEVVVVGLNRDLRDDLAGAVA